MKPKFTKEELHDRDSPNYLKDSEMIKIVMGEYMKGLSPNNLLCKRLIKVQRNLKQGLTKKIKIQMLEEATYEAAANFLCEDESKTILEQYEELKINATKDPDLPAISCSNPVQSHEYDSVNDLLKEINDIIQVQYKFVDLVNNLKNDN